jgi:hypothetical protein
VAWRRAQVAELVVAAGGFLVPGVRSRIARHLRVSRATISRDVTAILRGLHSPWCSCCGALRERALDRLDELLEDGPLRAQIQQLRDQSQQPGCAPLPA